MSNTKKINIKLIVCSIILAICMLVPAFAGYQFNSKKEAFAGTSDNIVTDVSSELLSTYYNFNTSSNSKPATPSGWTEITASSVNKDNIVRGIVDVSSETTFNTSTYKTTKPNMPTDTSSDKAYYKNRPGKPGRFTLYLIFSVYLREIHPTPDFSLPQPFFSSTIV